MIDATTTLTRADGHPWMEAEERFPEIPLERL